MDRSTERPPERGRTLTGLFADLWRETARLVHDEAELAKAEVSAKVSQVGEGIAGIAVAGGILFAGFLVLLFSAVGALALFMSPETATWLPALIVGGVVLIIGWIMLSSSLAKVRAQNLKPRRSIDSLRRDSQLIKEHAK